MFKTGLLVLWGLGFLSAAGIAKPIRVGLLLDKGGRDDKSFNASAFKGATEAKDKLGIILKVVESSDDASLEPALRTFAQHGFDLVVGIGFILQTPIKKVAAEFPPSPAGCSTAMRGIRVSYSGKIQNGSFIFAA